MENMSEDIQLQLKEFIYTASSRRPRHRQHQQQKSKRKRPPHPFLNTLLPHFHYQRSSNTYDIFLLDSIGNTLQGMCICRTTHTIVMGERSNKGYATLAPRPHSCLAKTMAHELGHALNLEHTRNKCFVVDQSPRSCSGNPNLMEGGMDSTGGGGYFLEMWQISLARDEAKRFLLINSN